MAKMTAASADLLPPADCALCPRLAAFRAANRASHPAYANRPVPSFGPQPARLLIVGLAPGMHGANRTGRPFTGDYAGDLLYETLLEFGFARGRYDRDGADDLTLLDARLTNAVRCLPPQNKPETAEIHQCRPFLVAEIAATRPRAILALGRIAHDSTARALGHKPTALPFAHGARHDAGHGVMLFDSYHCSRYNTNTGVLTAAMFKAVFANIRKSLL